MAHIFANNVAGTLAAGIGPSDSLILLGAGQGVRFPAPAGGDYYYATLVHITTGAVEIVRVTGRTVDTLTVERGRDSTSAIAFTTGSIVEVRLVAQALRDIDFRSGANLANGALILDGGGKVPVGLLPATVPIMSGGKVPIANLPDELITAAELAASLGAYLPLGGGTVSGLTQFNGGIVCGPSPGNGGWIQIGDDAKLIDTGIANGFALQGTTNPAIGYLYFGNTGHFIGWNGSSMLCDNGVIWHSNNFNPGSYLPLSGGTLSGALTVGGSTQLNSNLLVLGDTFVRRGANGAHGLLYFGSGAADYILMDGSNWSFGGGKNVYANDFVSTSDREKKGNITYRESGIGIADHLKLADFTWKDSGLKSRGIIAQDVEEYLPQFVYELQGTKYVDKAGFTLELVSDLLRRVQRLEATACP